jgi:hypothetical protein
MYRIYNNDKVKDKVQFYFSKVLKIRNDEIKIKKIIKKIYNVYIYYHCITVK